MLAAAVSGGYIWTNGDSGLSWIQATNSGARGWQSIASSSNGTKLAAVQAYANIHTSTDRGASWTSRALNRAWVSIASSSDGTMLAAVVNGGGIWMSSNSGATWTLVNPGGAIRNWESIASSSDGTKLAAVVNPGFIYTSDDSGTSWTVRYA